MKFQGSEDAFQSAIARYLDHLGALWCHVPNGGSRHKAEAGKLKAMGVKRGVPDVMIFEPRGDCVGMALELKTKSNKPTQDQTTWMDALRDRGWFVTWTSDLDRAIELIDEYLKQ